MTYSNVLLSAVTACVECGTMQPTGFRGGTPVTDTDDPDVHFDVGDSEIPDHVDDRYNVWASHNECPNCGNQFYHRLHLPTPPRLEATFEEDDEDWHAWGDL
jgi:hypothetical protein